MPATTRSLQTLDLDGLEIETCCYQVDDLSTAVHVLKSFDAELEAGRSTGLGRLVLPEDIFTLTRLLPNDEFLQQVILLPDTHPNIECVPSRYRLVCKGIRWTAETQEQFNQAWCSQLRYGTPFQAALYDLCWSIENDGKGHAPASDFAFEVCRYFFSADYVQSRPFLDSHPLKSMAIMTSLSRAIARLSRRFDRQDSMAKVLADVERLHQATFDNCVLGKFPDADAVQQSNLAKILLYAGSEASLEKLKTVEKLSFSGQPFDDLLLRKLKFLEGISILDLSYTAISSDAAQHLRWLSNLKELSLAGTRLHNHALIQIARCSGLLRLDLSGTLISDEGLNSLSNLKRLQQINLQGTNVTDQGRAELGKRLPFCRIAV